MRRSKKQLKRQLKQRPVTITAKEQEKMQRKATNDAVQITNLFNLWVLRTKYGFGPKRLREFMEYYNDLLDSFNKGYVSLPDIAQQLEKETGIRLDKENIND